jgi:hypothetical protein
MSSLQRKKKIPSGISEAKRFQAFYNNPLSYCFEKFGKF